MQKSTDDFSFALDLFSTSPTSEDLCLDFSLSDCKYNAPFFAYQKQGKTYGVLQGCCNHWDCPRCGVLRAKHEYGRIVEGARKLVQTGDLYFITITCRGKEMPLKESQAHYLEWTNRFLDACRAKAKRTGQAWVYVQVTERQKRGHPHSHILTTFNPMDLEQGTKPTWKTDNTGKRKKVNEPCLRSKWLAKAVVSAGLGSQYDISIVDKVEGASRYVAKYLFKDEALKTKWPKGWKRVRYSQSFPKLPDKKSDAFVLMQKEDWKHLAKLALFVEVEQGFSAHYTKSMLRGSDTIVIERRAKNEAG